jgi:hypothetical protein
MLMYTSLKLDVFNIIDAYLQRFDISYIDGWTPQNISRTDQLLLTLMKIKMNLPVLDLAERFNTSTASVNNIFISYIYALHETLYEGLIHIPGGRDILTLLYFSPFVCKTMHTYSTYAYHFKGHRSKVKVRIEGNHVVAKEDEL